MIVDERERSQILESIDLPSHDASSDIVTETSLRWWHKAIIYQVFLRSFADANDDGDGDIAGLVSRLAYIKDLGVDAVWISPWYVSPMHDGGYDVSNYLDVDSLFGTLEDVQNLVDASHELGLRVVLDLVANHCSSQHPWFRSALASPEGSKERDWFYFKNGQGEGGDQPPNDWKSIFGGPAWTRTQNSDGSPGQWYFNLFDSSQPDLNWKNEEVLKHFDEILRFWFDRGIDGFRLDAVSAIGKDDDYRDMGFAPDDMYRPDIWGPVPFFDADGVHDVLRRWRRVAQEYSTEKFLVGEVVVRDVDRLARYLRRDELQSTLSFDLCKVVWDADAFRQMINTLQSACLERRSWVTWTLSSHDEKRTVSRYSQDGPAEGVLCDVSSSGPGRGTCLHWHFRAQRASFKVKSSASGKSRTYPRTSCVIQFTSAPANKISDAMVVAYRCPGMVGAPLSASVRVMNPGCPSRTTGPPSVWPRNSMTHCQPCSFSDQFWHCVQPS
jgi:glycosidase